MAHFHLIFLFFMIHQPAWRHIELFREAPCEVLRIIESYLVGNFRNIHILGFSVFQNQLPCYVQTIIPYELSGRLADEALQLFIHQTFAYAYRFAEIADLKI